jgi:hypothetical protein
VVVTGAADELAGATGAADELAGAAATGVLETGAAAGLELAADEQAATLSPTMASPAMVITIFFMMFSPFRNGASLTPHNRLSHQGGHGQ